MSYAPVEMRQPVRRQIKYVYVKMLRAQVDSREGKLSKGDVLVLDEEKAMRWVYRARIARPSTREEYDNFTSKMRRTSAGSRRLKNQPMLAPREGENPFEYVDQQSPEWDNAEAENQEHMSGEWEDAAHSTEDQEEATSLAGQLESFALDTSPGDEDEDDETYDEGYDPNAEQAGVYDQSVDRGPGENVSKAEAERRKPKRGRRR